MISFGTKVNKQPKVFNSSWLQPPEEMVLGNDEAHVWLISSSAACVSEFNQIISDEERERAARFHFARHKAEYLAARSVLRIILGGYSQTDPRLLRIEYNEYGKPSIANQTKSRLKFNVSHSSGFSLIAVTLDSEIGIDFERIDPLHSNQEIAAKSLTKTELECFDSLNPGENAKFFYQCWTRKEAYSKAVGKGLSINPCEIETIYPPVGAAGKLETNKIFQKNIDWSFFDLPPITGFAAAAVVEGISKTKLKFWKIPN